MTKEELKNISPIDGRYSNLADELRPIFSEFGLMKYRVLIELEWFIHLSEQRSIPHLPKISTNQKRKLYSIFHNFSIKEAKKIKKYESKTNHDVKAVEYFLKEQISSFSRLTKYQEFIHFGCTSEDINNLAYGLMVKEASQKIILNELNKLTKKLRIKSRQYASISMLSRTHGQSATPTTLGKELANFLVRAENITKVISETKIKGKINGAVGNYNAHVVAYPKANWEKISKNFVTKLGLVWSPYTTQVEPKDTIAKLMHGYVRLNNVFIDFSRDMWGYISLGYFLQKQRKGEIGSSTMPHKINPIDFENAEGNFGVANSNLQHISSSVTLSRWQRDLSDSTVMRNTGISFAHILIAIKSLIKGIDKLKVNKTKINNDLESSLEVLTEAIQTIMRKYSLEGGYELMKKISKGKNISKKELDTVISSLDIPRFEKDKLKKLSPSKYIGLAEKLAKKV